MFAWSRHSRNHKNLHEIKITTRFAIFYRQNKGVVMEIRKIFNFFVKKS